MADRPTIQTSFDNLYIINLTGDIEADEQKSQMELLLNNTLNIVTDAVNQVDAEAGTSTDLKLYTPQRVAQAIDALEQKTYDTAGVPVLNALGEKQNDYVIDSVNNIMYRRDAGSFTAILTASGVDTNFTTGNLSMGVAREHTVNAGLSFLGTGIKIITADDGGGNVANATIQSTGFNINAVNGSGTAAVSGSGAALSLNSTTGSYVITTQPTLDSDVGGLVLIRDGSGNLIAVNENAYRPLSGAADPISGTTVAYFAGQLYTNVVSGDIFVATSKSTNPDSAGTGSVWAAVSSSDTNLINTNGLTTTDVRSHTIDHAFTLSGAGTQTYTSTTGGTSSLVLSGSAFRMQSSTGVYEMPTFPAIDSDVSGNILLRSTTGAGEFRIANYEAFRNIGGSGSPTDGSTNAWYTNQLYVDNNAGNLFRVSNKATDPDAGTGTGSQFVPIRNYHYPDRDSLETATSGDMTIRNYVILDRYQGLDDPFAGTSSFTLDLRNHLDNTPTVSINTTVSIEVFDYLGRRVVGGAWEYDVNKDINADAPDATATATTTYGNNTGMLDANGNALAITGWADVQSRFTGTIDVSAHTLDFVWDRFNWSFDHILYNHVADSIDPETRNYTIIVSIQENDNLRSTEIRFRYMDLVDPGVRYTFGHVGDQSDNPMLLYTAGEYVAIGDPTNSPRSAVTLIGGGALDGTNSNLSAGQAQLTPTSLYWTQGSWDIQVASVNVGIRYDLHPFVIAAQSAWVGTQTANTQVYYFIPNAAYNDDLFIKNFDIEVIAPDPFGGDVVSAQHVGAVFDHTTATTGRGDLLFQDQASEFYWMTYNGTIWSNQTSAKGQAFPMGGIYLIDAWWIDANNFVVISRSGNSGSVSFDLWKYSAGSRYDSGSWTRIVVSGSGAYAKGIWDQNGATTNGEVDLYTINQSDGQPIKFEYDGANYVVNVGSAVITDVNDLSFYGGEFQSASVINNEALTRQMAFSHGRKAFNRDGYAGTFFDLDGRHLTTNNTNGTWTRNGTSIKNAPSRFY